MSKKVYPYLLPFRCIVFILVFVIGSSLVHKNINDISNWWSIVTTVVNILTILLLVFVARKNNQTYKELINYKKGSTKPKEVILISILVLVVGMLGMYLSGLICYGVIPYMSPMMIGPIPAALAIINVIMLPITVPLAEDGLYLGCGVNHIKNKYVAIIVPALFFALQHSFIPLLIDAQFMLYRFLSFLPLTFILCAYYHKKRNPLPIMIGHGIIDMFTVIWILATSLNPDFYDKLCSLS